MAATSNHQSIVTLFPWRYPPDGRFRPDLVRTGRRRLIRSQPVCIDFRNDEVFGRDGISGQPPEHRELTDMGHRICERPLEQALRRHPVQQCEKMAKQPTLVR
jgi:hypothetical protein